MSKYLFISLLCLTGSAVIANERKTTQNAITEHAKITQAKKTSTTPSATLSEMHEEETARPSQESPTDSSQPKACKHSLWKHFFLYFGLTWPGALTMLGVFISLSSGQGPKISNWNTYSTGISIVGLLCSISIALGTAYLYTKDKGSCEYSFGWNALGFFVYCVVGAIACFSFVPLIELSDNPNSMINEISAFLIPILGSLVCCVVGALLNVYYFNKHQEVDDPQEEATQVSSEAAT